MRWYLGLAVVGTSLLLSLVGCGGHQVPGLKCPQPIAYDNATLKKIEKAREKLPRDSILQQVLVDYENERDDLRFCSK